MENKKFIKSKPLLIAVSLGLALTLVVTGMLSGGLPPVVYATTFTVTRPDDPAPDGCKPGDCSLREAIDAANTTAGPDTITLGSNTYQLSIANPSGVPEDSNAAGDLDITESLTISGIDSVTAATIIDGSALDRVFHVLTGSLSIDNLTIQNGYISNTIAFEGGAIYYDYDGGSLILFNTRIYSNVAQEDGGGLYIAADNTTVNIRSSHFEENKAWNLDGGAFESEGLTTTLTVQDSYFYHNWANADGGAINIDELYANVTISASTFFSNTCGEEGGALTMADDYITVLLQENTFRQNHSGEDGGAVACNGSCDYGSITAFGNEFFDNTAEDDAGAFNAEGEYSTIILANNLFENNRTVSFWGDTGGAFRPYGDPITLTLTNNVFTHNISLSSGGGISFESDPAFVNMSNNSFINNEAIIDGGAISFDGDGTNADLGNITFSGNKAGRNGGAIAVSGQITISYTSLDSSGMASLSSSVGDEEEEEISDDDTDDNQSLSATDSGLGAQAVSTTSLRLNNVTIADNTADNDSNGTGDGGGFWIITTLSSAFEVANTIIATNIDTGDEAPDCAAPAGALVGHGYNLVGISNNCNWVLNTGDQVGSGASPIIPGLDPLAGSLPYHPLKIDSPAIDSANPAPIGDPYPACLISDQRGVSRPQGLRCDIGAYELNSFYYLPFIRKS